MMTGAELIPRQLLKRKAVVYVRQSTQSQVMVNLESQRRQYDLVNIARQHGFTFLGNRCRAGACYLDELAASVSPAIRQLNARTDTVGCNQPIVSGIAADL
jgi:hypothetical protein